MIRLYGIGRGNSSLARVTDGVRQGLEACGVLAGFYDLDRVDTGALDDGDILEDGYDAETAICVGTTASATVMVGRGNHRERLLMLFPNSSWMPETMMEKAARSCTGFITASRWGVEVLKRHARGLPVLRYPLGVDQRFSLHAKICDPLRDREKESSFTVLHLASTHMQRKGTAELIVGWAKAMREGAIPRDGTLRMIVDGPRGYFLDAIGSAAQGDTEIADSYILDMRHDLSVEDMCSTYIEYDFICQPSRGEGWGMVPQEARACGVAVITTACTSHADHVRSGSDGVVVIRDGPEQPIDDGPGAVAPSVDPNDIMAALAFAREHQQQLFSAAVAAAPAFRNRWSWAAVTRRFLEQNPHLCASFTR